MNETIILCNQINENEMAKSIALRGNSLWNVRIMNSVELARYALIRAGIAIDEKIISRQDSVMMIATIMQKAVESGGCYFNRTNYQEAVNVESAIRKLRTLIKCDEEQSFESRMLDSSVVFKEKNQALTDIYKEYVSQLASINGIDSIGIIRKAISSVAKNIIQAKFIIVEEFGLTPLDCALLNSLAEDAMIERVSVSQLFGVTSTGNVRVRCYSNCYGVPNEAQMILSQIYSSGTAADQNVIVMCSVTDYSQIFYDLSMIHNIPVSFGCGVALVNSYPGKLLELYYHWKTDGYYGVDALKNMIFSPYFNRTHLMEILGENVNLPRLIEVCGALRLSDSESTNRELLSNRKDDEQLTEMAAILTKTPAEFVEEFGVIRCKDCNPGDLNVAEAFSRKLDYAAISRINSTLGEGFGKLMESAGISVEDIIPRFLMERIARESSREGYIHITSVEGGYSTVRKNVHICGLACKNYPGTPSENHLILDDDLLLFENGEKYISTAVIADKKTKLVQLVSMLTDLGTEIFVSYAGLNVAELKKENASSVLFDLLRKEYGECFEFNRMLNKIGKIGYFDTRLAGPFMLGAAYVRGEKINKSSQDDKTMGSVKSGEIVMDNNCRFRLSPTAMEMYNVCERKFMYKYLMKIKIEEAGDEFSAISPADEGTLAHKVMEKIALEQLDREGAERLAESVIDDYLRDNRVLVEADGIEAKQRFVELIRQAYDYKPEGEIVGAEDELAYEVDSSLISLIGRPDCIMKNTNNRYVIIDYKTGGRINHVENNRLSCLQAICYAYLAQKKGYDVEKCEYRYLRAGNIITCQYDDEGKQLVEDLISSIDDSLKTGRFNCNRTIIESPCENCEYKDICSKY